MATHDYNIANQGFPAFRADLNDALAAIVSNNSNATAPATTFAHQWWMDTSANPSILKVRNADNDAWITLGTFNQSTDTFTPSGASSDKIEEGNSKVEVVDTGTGYIVFEVDGAEVARFNPDQLVTKAGTASTPAVSPTGDLNTGIFFPAADTIAFAEGGAEAMRITSDGRLGIGTTAPAAPLEVLANSSNALSLRVRANASNFGVLRFASNDGNTIYSQFDSRSDGFLVTNVANIPMVFATNDIERARITSGGQLAINTTSAVSGNTSAKFVLKGASGADVGEVQVATNGTLAFDFRNSSGTQAGSITVNASTVAYNTSSDYRLKENIAPMTGALATVAQLNPVTYTWKTDGSSAQGFIAHELQAIVPDCVTGEKDAEREVDVFDEEGNKTGTKMEPVYQGVDTSFLVATLTAAIQELKAINDAQASRIETLEAKVAALESGS